MGGRTRRSRCAEPAARSLTTRPHRSRRGCSIVTVSGPSPNVQLFEGVRPRIIARLGELRGSLDPVLARCDDQTAAAQLSSLLDRLVSFLLTRDEATQRDFIHTYLAMRAAEAQGAGAALGTLVAIGDVSAQIVSEELAGRPGAGDLVRALTHATAATARLANNVIAEELGRRRAHKRVLEDGAP